MFASVCFCLSISIVIRGLVVTLFILTQLACTWQHTTQRFNDGLRTAGLRTGYSVSREHIWVLPPQAKVMIDHPIIDSSLEQQYPQFREHLTSALYRTAGVRFRSVLQVEQQQDKALLRERALEQGVDYILQPSVDVILDSSTKQVQSTIRSLKVARDKVTLRVKVMDVQSYVLLDTVIVKAGSVLLRKNVETTEALFEPALTALFTRI